MLATLHIIVSILLSGCIIIQQRSGGLSSALGGQMGSTNVVQRRGAEKVIFKASIWLSIAFFGLAITRWYVNF